VDVDSFEAEIARPGALDKAFGDCDAACDVVIVDTPSGLGRVTTAALACADFALLAFQTESLALRSVGQALKVVEHIQATRNPRLRLLGILPTLVERERHGSHAVLSEIWNGFPTPSRRSCRARRRSLVRAAWACPSASSVAMPGRPRPGASTCSPTSSRTHEPPGRHGEVP